MKIHGYCEKCHRIRRVRMGSKFHGTVAIGICDQCEEKARPKDRTKPPHGFRVTLYKVENEMWDVRVWRNNYLVLSTSGTAFDLTRDARECGIKRAWDIAENKKTWS